jgi:hypothetical protein
VLQHTFLDVTSIAENDTERFTQHISLDEAAAEDSHGASLDGIFEVIVEYLNSTFKLDITV